MPQVFCLIPVAGSRIERVDALHRQHHHVELGITLEAAGRWAEAKAQFDRALALPTGWVTDDHNRAIARKELARVRVHLG